MRERRMRRRGRVVVLAAVAALAVVPTVLARNAASASSGLRVSLVASPASAGISSIKHVIVIMQENRSFDHYFGMYPGADGIPVDANGKPTVCENDPQTGTCVYPWHDPSDISNGGPHGSASAVGDINKGAMNGFIVQYENSVKSCQKKPGSVDCGVPKPQPDVMSYKLRSDLPEYWAYADNYVLQDHLFAPGLTWSLPQHLFMVSGWSARCYQQDAPMSCENEVDGVDDARFQSSPNYAWTDITQSLAKNSVSWGYYVFDGSEPDCVNPQDLTCIPLPQSAQSGSIWNPLPFFTDVKVDKQLGNIQSVDNFAAAARNGTLPAVSWVVPTASVSEHPPATLSDGRKYVTYMINQVMQGPDWNSSAIFLAWDDWGGFYDHVVPPKIDVNGAGLRVPGLLISPYAKQGFVDHATYTFDSYLKFIEDDFLGGQRLDPTTDGRPDPRPVVAENYPGLGDLTNEFDFTQAPRPPLVIGNTNANAIEPQIHPAAKQPTAPTFGTKASPSQSIFPTVPAATASAGSRGAGAQPRTFVFDGSRTTDPGNPVARWTLDFGDGTSTNGTGPPSRRVSHTYSAAGTYTAHLRVTDQASVTRDDAAVVNVAAVPPNAWISGDKPLGFDVLDEKFDASQSSPGNWTVSFGDGSPNATGTGTPPAALAHHFAATGIYTTTLTVIDPGSGLSNVARAITTVSASRAPTAVSKAPDVGATTAHLLADIWSNGKATTFHFEWGTSPNLLTNITPERTAPMGTTSPAELISGLVAGKQYYFRVVATNSVGVTHGLVLSFAPAGGPKVTAQAAKNITATSATLTGTVNASGLDTTAWWQYGIKGAFDHSTAPVDVGSGKAKVTLTFQLTSLTPHTSYSFRLVASNSTGQKTSPTHKFLTLASAAVVRRF
jgi:phospholipase C